MKEKQAEIYSTFSLISFRKYILKHISQVEKVSSFKNLSQFLTCQENFIFLQQIKSINELKLFLCNKYCTA